MNGHGAAAGHPVGEGWDRRDRERQNVGGGTAGLVVGLGFFEN